MQVIRQYLYSLILIALGYWFQSRLCFGQADSQTGTQVE